MGNVVRSIFLSFVNNRVDYYRKLENPVIRDLMDQEEFLGGGSKA
jgi:hypothetical protein